LTVNRFGIVVSKKVDSRAVVRNKVKRFFRTTLVNLNEKMTSGHDILFVVKKEFLNKTKEENLLTVESILKKAKLI
jgi:ribonuclease P protein component